MNKDVVKEAIKEVLTEEKQNQAQACEAKLSQEPATFTVARASNGFIVHNSSYGLNYIGAAPKSEFPKIATSLDDAISIITGAIKDRFAEAA